MADRMTGGLILPDYAQSMADGLLNYNKQKVFQQQQQEYQRQQALLANTNQARTQAARGDYSAARETALGGMNFDAYDALEASEQQHVQQRINVGAGIAFDLRQIEDPNQRAAVFAARRPSLHQLGLSDAELDAIVPNIGSNAFLDAHINAGVQLKDKMKRGQEVADKQAEYDNDAAKESRRIQFDPTGGGYVADSAAPGGFRQVTNAGIKPQLIENNNPDGTKTVQPYAGYGGGLTYQGGAITGAQLYSTAIEPMESGGRAGVVGPMTRYGQAQGASQMLPATAQAMAKKLGVQWHPELMTAKSAEGLAYQRSLGIAYADEALKYANGDPAKALGFYHGGPNQQIWGEKTRAYQQNGLQRLQGGQAPAQNNSGAVTVGVPGKQRPATEQEASAYGYKYGTINARGEFTNGHNDTAASTKGPNEGQAKAGSFYSRLNEANNGMQELYNGGYNAADVSSGVDRAAGNIPLVGNFIMSRQGQQQRQYEDNFLTAQLRRESGASISPSEFATGERLYFPRAGDSKEVLMQKARARKTAVENMKREAGPALRGAQAPAPAPANNGGSSLKNKYGLK